MLVKDTFALYTLTEQFFEIRLEHFFVDAMARKYEINSIYGKVTNYLFAVGLTSV